MNTFFNTRLILIGILLFAAFLRFWHLGSVPPSASMDEASISYNAYSVLKTGGDEYGQLPFLSHRAYDDWRRATYLYLSIPFIAVFDLQTISIRLPAAILSILTVLATYYVVLSLFQKRTPFAFYTALLTTFLLAISPWHIYISRLGHESNACFSFLIFGILFFLQGEKNKSRSKLLISIIFFTLSMVSYPVGLVFIPLFIVGVAIIFKKSLFSIISSDKKTIFIFFVIAAIFISALMEGFSPKALIRFHGTSTFTPEAHWKEFSQRVELRNKAVANDDLIGIVVYNYHFFPVQVFIEGYLSHFSHQWLFTNSFAESFKAPNMGLLYLWQFPFILIGIIAFLFSRTIDMNIKQLVFLWFLLSPIPGAIATQAPHAMRSYSIVPVWQVFTAFGLIYVFYKLQRFKLLYLIVFVVIMSISLFGFYKNYFIFFPKEQSNSFHYALSRTIPYVLSQEKNYKKIVFSNKDNLYQSYMLFLYHGRYDPAKYQKLGGTKSGGYAESHAFDKYEFRPVDFKKEQAKKGVLYVVNSSEIPVNSIELKTFTNLDGSEAIKIFTK